VRERLHALAQAAHKDCGGRLIRPDHLHLTLVFLGDVARAKTFQLEAIAQQQCRAGFNLEFGKTGYWRHNRIVWVAPISIPGPLRALVAALERSLRHADIQFDRRSRQNEYVPHITLIRDARAPAALPTPQFGWRINDFALIESVRGAKEAEYHVLARWPLHADQ
jgi:RNA 2',3'-cyclic 3'-phosphodiesterase